MYAEKENNWNTAQEFWACVECISNKCRIQKVSNTTAHYSTDISKLPGFL